MITIVDTLLAEVFQRATVEAPKEACGYLLEWEGGRYTSGNLENRDPDPEQHFTLDPAQWCQAIGLAATRGLKLCFWHSHPTTHPVLNDDDLAVMRVLQVPFLIVGVRVPVAHLYVLEGVHPREVGRWTRETDGVR